MTWRENLGVYAAGKQAHAVETVAGEFVVERGGGRERDPGAIMKVSQIGERGPGEERETVVAAVAVKIGVEA